MDVIAAIDAQGRRARAVVWLLGISGAIGAASVASGLAQWVLLEQMTLGDVSTAEATANDVRHGAIAAVQLLALVVTAVAWLRWAHRAHANLSLFGTRRTDHTPAAAVYSWFIPILNLFRPYQITKELWLRSRDANAVASLAGARGAGLLAAWWTAWLAGSLLGQAVYRMTQGATTIPQLQEVTAFGIASDVAHVAGAVLALKIVRRVDAWQRSASVAARAVEALS